MRVVGLGQGLKIGFLVMLVGKVANRGFLSVLVGNSSVLAVFVGDYKVVM